MMVSIALKKALKVIPPLVLLLLLVAMPGYGQISFNTKEKHGREMRKSLKEAAKADIAYKETHLNTNAYTFKKGAARKRIKKDELANYQFNERGKPIRWYHFLKKKRKQEKKKD